MRTTSVNFKLLETSTKSEKFRNSLVSLFIMMGVQEKHLKFIDQAMIDLISAKIKSNLTEKYDEKKLIREYEVCQDIDYLNFDNELRQFYQEFYQNDAVNSVLNFTDFFDIDKWIQVNPSMSRFKVSQLKERKLEVIYPSEFIKDLLTSFTEISNFTIRMTNEQQKWYKNLDINDQKMVTQLSLLIDDHKFPIMKKLYQVYFIRKNIYKITEISFHQYPKKIRRQLSDSLFAQKRIQTEELGNIFNFGIMTDELVQNNIEKFIECEDLLFEIAKNCRDLSVLKYMYEKGFLQVIKTEINNPIAKRTWGKNRKIGSNVREEEVLIMELDNTHKVLIAVGVETGIYFMNSVDCKWVHAGRLDNYISFHVKDRIIPRQRGRNRQLVPKSNQIIDLIKQIRIFSHYVYIYIGIHILRLKFDENSYQIVNKIPDDFEKILENKETDWNKYLLGESEIETYRIIDNGRSEKMIPKDFDVLKEDLLILSNMKYVQLKKTITIHRFVREEK